MKASRRGFALLSALWLMVMLSGLGLHIATRARADRLSAANRVETARARAAADAGVEHARARLTARLRPSPEEAGAANAPPRHPWYGAELLLADTVHLGAARYTVWLHDANSRLNLNRASADDLRALLVALRVDAGVADRLAQAIEDWRDPDDLRHPRGAERTEYLQTGARVLPTNGPFARIEELRDVREVTPALYSRLRPFVTLAGSGALDPNTADEPVLLSIPGFTPEVVAAIGRLRGSGILLSSADQLLAALPSGTRNRLADRAAEWRPRLAFETRELEFESEGWMEQGAARVSVRGTFVRAGDAVLTTDRRVQ